MVLFTDKPIVDLKIGYKVNPNEVKKSDDILIKKAF